MKEARGGFAPPTAAPLGYRARGGVRIPESRLLGGPHLAAQPLRGVGAATDRLLLSVNMGPDERLVWLL